MWLCQCQCGTIKPVRADDLRQHKSLSCGCKKSSKGEDKIREILIANNIEFEEQFTIYTNNSHYYFDFLINKEYFIEYDGIQHFKSGPNGHWGDELGVEKTQIRDNIKNQYCIDNNIPLIRIPYTHLSKITLDDLLIERSQYVYR